ncbi:glycosyltransferase family 4 protein [Vagococcus fluvialis]|uniref:glycosyltransferase family 4 protein n=1 Tax=Vagococcus fluvialis TaxID=2738 RepID=UPI001D0B8E55|nr:glycosyltransferase family 4 protein [Vagococcus fluvialis]UDM73880.1 glycosyltransferase family 4 protein [Vagococcus fluvialis]
MKILFLTLLDIDDIEEKNIYTDLMREFSNNGHNVTIISPIEKRNWEKEIKLNSKEINIIKARIGNITKTNVIEKGISTIFIDKIYLKTIKKKLDEEKFDLVIYTTPPITFTKTISYLKKNPNTITYLLLKDIFPQNAVDLQMMKKTSLLYKYFRKKEEQLYLNADLIGCMSQKNVDYILRSNKNLYLQDKIHVSPNSIEVQTKVLDKSINSLREIYNLPTNKKIFIYGGNIGKPQGIEFLLKCLVKLDKKNVDAFFVIVGSGTEFNKVKEFCSSKKVKNLMVLEALPVEKFDELLQCSDFGVILLDHRFTIPNFPSRLLSYMQAKLPVLAATDTNTDVGEIISDNDFGLWSASNNEADFISKVTQLVTMSDDRLNDMKNNSFNFLKNNYSSLNSYEIILDKVNKNRGKRNV